MAASAVAISKARESHRPPSRGKSRPAAAGERSITMDERNPLSPFAIARRPLGARSGSTALAAGVCTPWQNDLMARSGRRTEASPPADRKGIAVAAARAEMPSEAMIAAFFDLLSSVGPTRHEDRICGTKPRTAERRSIVPEPYEYTIDHMMANCRTEEPKSEID